MVAVDDPIPNVMVGFELTSDSVMLDGAFVVPVFAVTVPVKVGLAVGAYDFPMTHLVVASWLLFIIDIWII